MLNFNNILTTRSQSVLRVYFKRYRYDLKLYVKGQPPNINSQGPRIKMSGINYQYFTFGRAH